MKPSNKILDELGKMHPSMWKLASEILDAQEERLNNLELALVDKKLDDILKDEGWKPKLMENYYFVNEEAEVMKALWRGKTWDEKRCRIGNCFKKEELAEQAALRVRQAYRGDQVKENLEVLEDIKHVACELNCRPHTPRC